MVDHSAGSSRRRRSLPASWQAARQQRKSSIMPSGSETTRVLAPRNQPVGARRPIVAHAWRVVVRPLGALAGTLARAVIAEWAVRRSLRQLSRMSDDGLRDIGLSRGDVERV